MLKLITAPVGTVVSLSEAKTHLNVNVTTDDTYITSLLTVAQDQIADELGASLLSTTWEEVFDCFPDDRLCLSRYPLSSVTSIKYYDADNVQQTVSTDNYHVMLPYNRQGYVQPVYGEYWPDTYQRPDAVAVRYVCGYATIPSYAKHAVKLLIGHWYVHRESEGQVTTELKAGLDRILRLMDKRGYA